MTRYVLQAQKVNDVEKHSIDVDSNVMTLHKVASISIQRSFTFRVQRNTQR